MFRFAQHDSAMSVSDLTSSLGFHHCFDICHLDPGSSPRVTFGSFARMFLRAETRSA